MKYFLGSCQVALVLLAGFVVFPAWGEESSIFIEGYAGRESVAPGEEIGFHVSTSVSKYDVEIVRLGAETESAYCEMRVRAADRGGKFTERGRRTAKSTCFFIVRSATPGKDTNILLQLSTNTYNAYNNWGDFSLYAYSGRNGAQGNRVSIERPPSSQFGNWEHPFVQWAERNGYTLDYAANSDLEFRPELLEKYALVLSVGHDEYWSSPMRDTLEAFIDRGGERRVF